MSVQLHKVERVFSTVAFEATERVQKRLQERAHIGLAEYTEEWHVAASGQVNNNLDFPTGEIELEFSMDFFLAKAQRRSDLTSPTFHYGSFQASATNFVVVTAAVSEWVNRNDGAFTGAKIRVGVHKPDADDVTPFDMLLHFSFSGWGAPYDLATAVEDDTVGGDG